MKVWNSGVQHTLPSKEEGAERRAYYYTTRGTWHAITSSRRRQYGYTPFHSFPSFKPPPSIFWFISALHYPTVTCTSRTHPDMPPETAEPPPRRTAGRLNPGGDLKKFQSFKNALVNFEIMYCSLHGVVYIEVPASCVGVVLCR